ncbi:LCP family protein [Streptomyces sp. HNM0574]|uniref:LCP family protein n=1 Tax=Streptomyces sp. HNM0574 TaxID=2714954 RepID=UPI00146BBC2E|nr:LCP family protein [Streptomyces sp. HNM0574]NLU65960.1 LCP family protein [Streptomyces sp. HNM0574]
MTEEEWQAHLRGRPVAGEPVHLGGPDPYGQGEAYEYGHPPGEAPPPPGNSPAPAYGSGFTEPSGRVVRARGAGVEPWDVPPPPGPRVPYGGYGDDSPYDPRRRAPRRRVRKRRPVRRFLLALLLVLFATPVTTYAWADTRLNRDVDLAASGIGQRETGGKGTNYLIVGSDSRDGLSEQEREDLHAGGGGGRRTDSMILLHTGAHGTTMVSLPRDSWVTVPAFTSPRTGKHHPPTKNKLNATFAMGGPKMLVRTVEHNTGVRIDHYAEIGFGGFVGLVDAVGGVRMCLDRAIRDEKSGADLRKGCQTLDGADALAFVRQRHQEAGGDLGRTRNQQKFLAALARQAAEPGTVLDPSTVYPVLRAGLDTLIVDEDTGLRELTRLFQAVRDVTNGQGKQLNVPTGRGISTPAGSALTWNKPRADRLFTQLRDDLPVTER